MPDRLPEVLLISAHSASEVVRRLDRALAGRPADAADPVESAGGPCRLAVVGPTPERLVLARKVIERGSPWRGRNDVWFTQRPLLSGAPGMPAGKVAFVFPGFEPDPIPPVDDVAGHFGVPLPPSESGRPGTPGIIGQAVDIVAVNRLLAGVLGDLGIRAQALAGHSLGEWTAMLVSGMCEFEDIDAFFGPVRRGEAAFPDVCYAALGCSAARAAAAIAGFDGVFVSHDNCPHQSVLCGAPDDLDAALDALRRVGILGQPMPLRSGFHTPLLAPCLEAGRSAFAVLNPRPPSVPVWSATAVAPYPADPEALRALVVRHLLEPVRFRELIERLYTDGVRAFVQVGAGSLVGFVEDTLGKREHLAVAAQAPGRAGLEQLARVAASLWVEQAPGVRGIVPNRMLRLQPVARKPEATTSIELTRHPTEPAGAHPVLAAFESAMAEASAAAHEVVQAWARASAAPARPPARAPVATARRERVFSLEAMPELRDHCLFPQPPGWPDDADRFPVVPVTTLLDVMAQEAAAHVPGLQVTGLSQVKALKWLAVAPPVSVPVEVAILESGAAAARVRVTLVGYAEGTVEFAAAFGPPPVARSGIRGQRRPAATAATLYADGWMFHGPGYQGVTGITRFGDDGIEGTLVALPAPGALLDAAGQLAGHWAQAWASTDRLAFPTGIDAVHYFGAHPEPGERLTCSVHVRSFSAQTLRVDYDVRHADATVWARIEGWTCRRFATDHRTWPAVHTRPSANTVGEPQPGSWCLVQERWPDGGSRDYVMRRYLTSAERADFDRLGPRARGPWLLGRIAAKDAARIWLWEHGHGELFPGQIVVSNDPDGRPLLRCLTGDPGSELAVSLAHTPHSAAAIVRPAGLGLPGIDLEPVFSEATAASVEPAAVTASELLLIEHLSSGVAAERLVWTTRIWAAKEAVSKARGTGFRGRPKDFVVTAVDGSDLFVTLEGSPPYRVHSALVAPGAPEAPAHVVAWTVPPGHPDTTTTDPLEAGTVRRHP